MAQTCTKEPENGTNKQTLNLILQQNTRDLQTKAALFTPMLCYSKDECECNIDCNAFPNWNIAAQVLESKIEIGHINM